MAKQLLFEQEAKEAIKRGVAKMALAVNPTLGPRGRAVVLDKSWGTPQISKDGKSIAEEVELTDSNENMGAQMIKEAASRTSDKAGDGSTTACVLAGAIFNEAIRSVVAGANPLAIKRGIDMATSAVVTALDKMAQKVEPTDNKRLLDVATVSAGNKDVGKILADTFAKVGKNGVITVEEGKGLETDIKIVEGMQFDRGFLSPHFVTDPETAESVLDQPYILLHEDKLTSATKLIPLLEKLAEMKASLLVVAEEVEGEALATLVVNKLRGILQCCAVKAPGYGDRRKAMLEDIGILTGGHVIFKDLGIDLEKVKPDQLGRAKRVRVDADYATIIEGMGDKRQVERRIAQIKKEIKETDSDYDREKLEERLAKLSGGIGQINVGAATETELKSRKLLIENAYHAVKAALEEGIVPGGGIALLRAQKAMSNLQGQGDENIGIAVIRKAIEAPFRQIVENAGFESSVLVKKAKGKEGAYGYDVVGEKFCDLVDVGVVDPVKVTKHALVNAASVASLLVTAEVLVSEAPEEKEKTPMPA